MTIEQVALLPAGTKVYWVNKHRVSSYWVIGIHPKGEKYLIFGRTSDMGAINVVYMPHSKEVYNTDYDLAKEAMWQDNIKELRDVNKIYFDGAKDISGLDNA